MTNDLIDIEHRVTVRRLRELLSELRDDDVLVPNMVQNLLIVRDGETIGIVDLLNFDTHIDIYDEEGTE